MVITFMVMLIMIVLIMVQASTGSILVSLAVLISYDRVDHNDQNHGNHDDRINHVQASTGSALVSLAVPTWASLQVNCLVIVVIIITRPRPAFGRLGLGGSSGGYSSHG